MDHAPPSNMGDARSSLCIESKFPEEMEDSRHLYKAGGADKEHDTLNKKVVGHGSTTVCPIEFALTTREGTEHTTPQTTAHNSGIPSGADLTPAQSQSAAQTTSQVPPIDNCNPDLQGAASEQGAISAKVTHSSASVPSSSLSYSGIADRQKTQPTSQTGAEEPKIVPPIERDETSRSDLKFASKSVVGYSLATELSDESKIKRRKRVAVKTVIREVTSNGYENEDNVRPHKKKMVIKVFDRESQGVRDTSQIIASQIVNEHKDEGKSMNPKKSTKKKESIRKVPGECNVLPVEGANETKASPEATVPEQPKPSPVSGKAVRGRAREVYLGPPTEPLEGGWPPGWIKQIVERQNGASAGHTDRYWYSPQTKRKFRSMVEIKRFLAHLKESGGDEGAAWIKFKTK